MLPYRQDARQVQDALRSPRHRPVKGQYVTLSTFMLMVSLAAPPAAAGQCRWWLEPGVQRTLGLSKSQVAAMAAEYSRTLKHRRRLRQEFDVAHAELTRAIERDQGSDAAIEAMVTRVERLRQRRNVARRQLLVALYFLLTAEQRVTFPGLLEQVPPPC
jgi:Spy/CpxP family protein refolding chaperone